MGRKVWGCCAPFSGGAGSPSNTMSPAPRPYLRTKWHLDPSSRLATIVMSRRVGPAVPFRGEELGPHLTQCRLGRDLHRTKWHLRRPRPRWASVEHCKLPQPLGELTTYLLELYLVRRGLAAAPSPRTLHPLSALRAST